MSKDPFSSWHKIYMDSVGDLSKDTWRKGILFEIQKRGIIGGTVLDLGGGNGVGSDLLQTLGAFHVTALDSSQAMLDLNKTGEFKQTTEMFHRI